jgi:hypothetical protein
MLTDRTNFNADMFSILILYVDGVERLPHAALSRQLESQPYMWSKRVDHEPFDVRVTVQLYHLPQAPNMLLVQPSKIYHDKQIAIIF